MGLQSSEVWTACAVGLVWVVDLGLTGSGPELWVFFLLLWRICNSPFGLGETQQRDKGKSLDFGFWVRQKERQA